MITSKLTKSETPILSFNMTDLLTFFSRNKILYSLESSKILVYLFVIWVSTHISYFLLFSVGRGGVYLSLSCILIRLSTGAEVLLTRTGNQI